MPYWRLMYDWDNNYTKKEKRMILLTQEAIDKINGLTPGGGAEYTAGSWIAISSQNVISNTAQFNPTNAWTTWQVLKKVGNSYSWANAEWWAMFVTQEEYDALPASKTTDGKEYIIVDTHCELKSYQELYQIADAAALATELNTCSEWYAYKLFNEWVASMGGRTGLSPGKYRVGFSWRNGRNNYDVHMQMSNLTVQELIDLTWMPQEAAESTYNMFWMWLVTVPIE